MNGTAKNERIVLTIAGFDPSGGAGIIADVHTIRSFGCIPLAVVTSITFQNSEKYLGAIHQTAEAVRAQIEALVASNKIDAVKIGMTPTADVVCEVARLIREFDLPSPVIDPVMESTSGGKLMEDEAFEVFATELLPHVRVVTANIAEAEKLAGLNIRDTESMRQAAARLRELGPRAVLIKGGHLKQEAGARRQEPGTTERWALDLLDDDGGVTVFRGEWIDAPNVRGTGCMLSSAIACGLARGDELKQAVAIAKQFVTERIQKSKLTPIQS